MRELRWYGSSDDTFGYEEGTTGRGDDHDDCGRGRLMAFSVFSPSEARGLIVTGQYAPKPIPDGTWIVGVTLLGEDLPIPEWPMRLDTSDLAYSAMLVMEAPDDVVITDLLLAQEGQTDER